MKREYVVGDIYDIASRVKDIDPALSLSFNKEKGKYELRRVMGPRGNFFIMYIKPGELDERVLVHLKKNDLRRRNLDDYIRELEQSEDIRERQQARELSNRIEDVTLDRYNKLVGIPQFACGYFE